MRGLDVVVDYFALDGSDNLEVERTLPFRYHVVRNRETLPLVSFDKLILEYLKSVD